jgi:hypothetical protein
MLGQQMFYKNKVKCGRKLYITLWHTFWGGFWYFLQGLKKSYVDGFSNLNTSKIIPKII